MRIGCEFLNVKNFKKHCKVGPGQEMCNPGEGEFVRKGEVGDWVNYMDTEEGKEWDKWATEQLDKIGVNVNKFRHFYGV